MTTGCVKMIEKMKKNFQKLENCDDDNSEEILPLAMKHLTPAMIEEARTQLHETEEVKQKALAKMRKMIALEKNLVCPANDTFLLAFLRSRKYNVKRAFKLLQNYWSFRKDYNKIYSIVDIEGAKNLILRNFIGLLEYRDRKGCVVFVAKVGLWDPETDTYENVFRAVSAILVFSLEFEATSIAGYRVIIDLRGVTWSQMKYFTPTNMLILVRSTQFCFPSRFKGIHVLADSKTLNFAWAVVYPFLTPKLKKRIFFHGEDTKPLLDYIHPTVLPKEFGGDGPPFENDSTEELINSRVKIVVSHLDYGYKD